MDNIEQIDFWGEFVNKFKEDIQKMGYVNLVVAGKTGIGKSTLINACFREELAKTGTGDRITEEIRMYSKKNFPLRIYDTMGLELSEEKRERAVNDIKKLYEDKKVIGNKDELIHAMWYCVDGFGSRFEAYEEKFVNEISKEMPVIIVLTKCIKETAAKNLKKYIEQKNTKAKNIIMVLAQSYDDESPAFGVKELVEFTYSILPDVVQTAWANAQKASLKLKEEKAHALVMKIAAVNFGVGFSPIPFSASAALVPIEIGMIAGITSIYGLEMSKAMLTGIVSSLIGTTAATFAGKTLVANILKMIPIIGNAAGGAIEGATAALITIALGEAYIAVMNMVYTGEITAKDIETGAFKDQLTTIFKDYIKKESKKIK